MIYEYFNAAMQQIPSDIVPFRLGGGPVYLQGDTRTAARAAPITELVPPGVLFTCTQHTLYESLHWHRLFLIDSKALQPVTVRQVTD